MAMVLLRPLKPIEGARYKATLTPDRKGISIQWYCKDRDDWMKVLEAVRALPSRKYDPTTKEWRVPNQPNYCSWLTSSGWPLPSEAKKPAGPKEPTGPDPVELQKQAISEVVLEDVRDVIPGLRPYQLDFLKFAILRRGRVALGDDMGTGKTLQSLAWLAYAHAFPALIVVNAPTKLQWRREYGKWLSKVPGLDTRVQVLYGKKPYLLDPTASAIINWDILADWRPALMKVGYKCLVGDEVQAIGNPNSQRAQAFRELSKKIPQVIAMSGTPARSKPAQFWSILNVLEPEVFPNYQQYLDRYCGPKHNGFSITYNGATHVDELHRNLVRCMIRRTKAEVMKDLPSKVMEVVPLEVDARAMNQYRMEEASAFDSNISGRELRERVSGLLRTAYALKEDSLLQWVVQFLDSGEKLLLFAWHRDVVDILVDSLKKYNPAKIYGGVGAKEREEARDRFIQDPECRVLVANIQSGGVGIDGFQEVCSNVAFAEFSHTPNDHRQAEDRLHRSGQTRSVTSYYLVAPDTIDMDAVEVLDERAKMLDGVLDGKAPTDIDLLGELLERRGIHVDTRGNL